MLLYKDSHITLESTGRNVSADEAAAAAQIQAMIQAAEAEAERIRQAAQAEVEAARKEGYQKGLDDGTAEIIQQKIKMVERSVTYLEQLEGRVVDVVVAALQKCVGELDCRSVVLGLIDQAMAAVVRTQRQMTIRVAPANLEVVKQHISELHGKYPSVTQLSVASDDHIGDTDCILETDAGIVDASLTVQLDAIEKAFRQCFRH